MTTGGVDQAGDGVEVLRFAAFTDEGAGGNPAGLVLDATGLDEAAMLAIAARVGYSETAFLTPHGPGRYRARYFSPGAEVPFCGHATLAAAVALAERHGSGDVRFDTPVGEVVVGAAALPGGILAGFTSVEPRVRPLADEVAAVLLGLLGLDRADLPPGLPLREAFAGNWHPIVALAARERFDGFSFDPAALRTLMDAQGWTGTVTVIHQAAPDVFEARNLFPVGAITEDPATGSAAAALGGYLRDLGLAPERFVIRQGRHVGRPSRLLVEVPASGGIRVSGTATAIA